MLRARGRDKFDPLVRHAPALLTIEGVRQIAFDGRYQLNATIMDAAAAVRSNGRDVEFVFDLSGGHDPDAYLVTLRIVGASFALGPG